MSNEAEPRIRSVPSQALLLPGAHPGGEDRSVAASITRDVNGNTRRDRYADLGGGLHDHAERIGAGLHGKALGCDGEHRSVEADQGTVDVELAGKKCARGSSVAPHRDVVAHDQIAGMNRMRSLVYGGARTEANRRFLAVCHDGERPVSASRDRSAKCHAGEVHVEFLHPERSV